MTPNSQELLKDVRHQLVQTWSRIGLGKVALANYLLYDSSTLCSRGTQAVPSSLAMGC